MGNGVDFCKIWIRRGCPCFSLAFLAFSCILLFRRGCPCFFLAVLAFSYLHFLLFDVAVLTFTSL
jgi:hypothetical protein